MARKYPRPKASQHVVLEPLQITCRVCGSRMRMGHHSHRSVTTLQGVTRLTLKVYRCRNTACSRFHLPTRPEEEGRWALPHGEFGLDIIAAIGAWRFAHHRSVPEMHQQLLSLGISIAEREVTHLMHRYEELVALHVADQQRLVERFRNPKACASSGRWTPATRRARGVMGYPRLSVGRNTLSSDITQQYTGGSDSPPERSERDTSGPRQRHYLRWARDHSQCRGLRFPRYSPSALSVSLFTRCGSTHL